MPLHGSAVRALRISSTQWMSWARRVDSPAVVAVTTEDQREMLHMLAVACQRLADGHGICSYVHFERVHSVCARIRALNRRILEETRVALREYVSDPPFYEPKSTDRAC